MKNQKGNFMSRAFGLVLSGVIGLISFSGLAVEAKSNENIQTKSSVSEVEKKSDQYFRTKTGKCYHRDSCSCLRKSKIEVTKEEIKEANLRPCKRCCK